MPDYQKLYTTLFNRVSDIIEELQKAQRETEELYISEEDENGPVITSEAGLLTGPLFSNPAQSNLKPNPNTPPGLQ